MTFDWGVIANNWRFLICQGFLGFGPFGACVYWACTYGMSRLNRWLERRMAPERASANDSQFQVGDIA